jgi:hypothetical protein
MSRYEEKLPFKDGQLILVIEQEGGCDYTIGCGVAVIPVASLTEAKEAIEDNADEETGVVRATLFAVKSDLTKVLEDIRDKTRVKKQKAEREEKRRTIERLKKELEET